MIAVYVAASSSEIERAMAAMTSLRSAGIAVTSTWPEAIEHQADGVANPRDADNLQRSVWSEHDCQEIDDSELLWFLAPVEAHGRGAYFELGYAYSSGLVVVSSGDTTQSIFTSIGHEFKNDADALEYICKVSRTP